MDLRIGCAGWSIPKDQAERFQGDGTHLDRYSRRFTAVEINSSFYRPHRAATYARWAASVPDDFRFAVKVPKEITHERRLVDTTEVLDRFLAEASNLGHKLGPLLVQLPPSLEFIEAVSRSFFQAIRERFLGDVVCEPRHETWLTPIASQLLRSFQVARAAADPAVAPWAAEPGGWVGLVYHRLHGTPRVYYSSYAVEYLNALAGRMVREANTAAVWCIFDNTALGAATPNAIHLQERMRML